MPPCPTPTRTQLLAIRPQALALRGGAGGERTLWRLSLSGSVCLLQDRSWDHAPAPGSFLCPKALGRASHVGLQTSGQSLEVGGARSPGLWTQALRCSWSGRHLVRVGGGRCTQWKLLRPLRGGGPHAEPAGCRTWKPPILPRLWHCTLRGPSQRTAAPGVGSKFTPLPVVLSPPQQLHPPPGDRTAWPLPAGSPPRAQWGTSRAAMETLRVETVGSRDGQCGHRDQGLFPVDALPTPPEGQGQDPPCPWLVAVALGRGQSSTAGSPLVTSPAWEKHCQGPGMHRAPQR